MKKIVLKVFTFVLLLSFMASPVLADLPVRGAEKTPESKPAPTVRNKDAPSLAVSETGLYIVQLEDASLTTYTGGIPSLQATSPQATGVSKLDTTAPASLAYIEYLEGKQVDFISRMGTSLGRSVEVRFQYLNVLNALAVKVSHEEAIALAQMPGVLAVYPDTAREIETDAGPALMGAPTFWEGDFGFDEHRGEGVIVAMLDTGVNPEHPSFAVTDGDGYTHTNPYGAGNYVGVCDPNHDDYDPAFPCNDKLIGAYNFYSGPDPQPTSARDWNDHGSHVGSTIAGNKHDADISEIGVTRTLSGVAPRANIISYLVCFPSCYDTGIVAATEQAINDGVDVLNYSISGGDDPWDDPVDLAFLDAFAAGVFVSASAGNDGPGASTVAKTGPWNASVAASTHNRAFSNDLSVTAPTAPDELQNIYALRGENVVIPADVEGPIKYDPDNTLGCEDFDLDFFEDSFALIQRGDCAFADKEANAKAAGAIGLVVFNNAAGLPIVMGATTGDIPAVMISKDDGEALRDYVLDNPDTTEILLSATHAIIDDSLGDIMGDFSSRGPSQWDLLKPDYTAPGVNILAAGHDGADHYKFLQGTSMSSPHGAGAAALMVQRHPDWTPAEIKSALAMTADQDMLKENGVDPAGYFDMGSGRVDLTLGAQVGLVMDETYANYLAADPHDGGEPKTLNQPSMVDHNCVESCSWTRSVRSVLDGYAEYQVIADAPAGVEITVVPDTFTIYPGATQVLEINVDVDMDVLEPGEWAYAQIDLALTGNSPTANGVLLQEGFEDEVFPPVGWTRYDLDEDGSQWYRAITHKHTGDASARHTYKAEPQEGWLVTPQIDIVPDTFLSFYDYGIWMGDYEYNGVWLSTGSCDPDDGDFLELREFDDTLNNAWRQVPPIDLSTYAGESACLAFVYRGEFAHEWIIDDVVIEVIKPVEMAATHKLPIAIKPFAESPEITLNPDEISSSQFPEQVMTKTLTIGNTGGVELEWAIEEEPGITVILGLTTAGDTVDEYPTVAVEGVRAEQIDMIKLDSATIEAPLAAQPTAEEDYHLVIDDGTIDTLIGIGGTWEFMFLNRFTPEPWAYPLSLKEIRVVFHSQGNVAEGDEMILVVYENTTGNADPAIGSNFLASYPVTVAGVPAWNVYELDDPLVLNGPGDVLIGVIALEVPGSDYWPAAIDTTTPQHRSWIGMWEDYPPPDPPLLPPDDTWMLIDGFRPGNWMIRGLATYNPVCTNPEDVPWLAVDPTAGTTPPAMSTDVLLSLDSTGMDPGNYYANLCITSNDPNKPLSVVPVEMEVVEPCLSVDPESLEKFLEADTTGTETLNLINACDVEIPYVLDAETFTLFDEGFEAGEMPPSGGWDTIHKGTTAREWTLVDAATYPTFIYEGNYAAWANYDGVDNSDEWLLSPVLDTASFGKLELSYWVRAQNQYFTDATLSLWVTDEAGEPLTTDPIWDMLDDEVWPYPAVYHQVVLDLSAYAGGGAIRIAWQYVGLDGDSVGLDSILLTGGAAEIPWLSWVKAGTIPAESTLGLEMTFDATGLALGDYEVALFATSGLEPPIEVPVKLHVVQAPEAEDQAVETLQDTPVEITLVATDPDDDPLTYFIVNEPSHGELQYGSGELPILTYVPDLGWFGVDSFTFKANNGRIDSNIATVTITVLRDNQPPLAVDDFYETDMDVSLVVPAPGVMANDIDPNPGDRLVVDLIDAPLHGTVDLAEDGSFTYVPNAGFFGKDSFTYNLIGIPLHWPDSDRGPQFIDSATVFITVVGPYTIFLPIIFR